MERARLEGRVERRSTEVDAEASGRAQRPDLRVILAGTSREPSSDDRTGAVDDDAADPRVVARVTARLFCGGHGLSHERLVVHVPEHTRFLDVRAAFHADRAQPWLFARETALMQ